MVWKNTRIVNHKANVILLVFDKMIIKGVKLHVKLTLACCGGNRPHASLAVDVMLLAAGRQRCAMFVSFVLT